jgi:hypothetical protein
VFCDATMTTRSNFPAIYAKTGCGTTDWQTQNIRWFLSIQLIPQWDDFRRPFSFSF